MRETAPASPATTLAARQANRLKYIAAQGLRVAWYGAHLRLLHRQTGGFDRPGEPAFEPKSPPGDEKEVRRAFLDLFRRDLAHVEEGLYPAPDDVRLRDLARALASSRRMVDDAPRVNERRIERRGTEVREAADPDRYPAYYRQNFHYQSGGWFTDDSARIYDTQVEVLFGGAADAMRRMVLAEASREFRDVGRSARVLDVACGTGRFLAQMLNAWPRLNAVGLDLSPAYCERARQAVRAWPRAEIVEGAAEAMPLEDGSQDVVTCIYLFHELPPKVRPAVAAEMARVLRPGGLLVFGDALQPGDNPALDRRLEYFPEGFHEPYFRSYGATDLAALFARSGLVADGESQAFLTKIQRWRKPG